MPKKSEIFIIRSNIILSDGTSKNISINKVELYRDKHGKYITKLICNKDSIPLPEKEDIMKIIAKKIESFSYKYTNLSGEIILGDLIDYMQNSI